MPEQTQEKQQDIKEELEQTKKTLQTPKVIKNPEISPEKGLHELGRNFFFLVMNYYKFELLNFYIKPRMPFEEGARVPIEK